MCCVITMLTTCRAIFAASSIFNIKHDIPLFWNQGKIKRSKGKSCEQSEAPVAAPGQQFLAVLHVLATAP
jgi:hypothetical protein